MKNFWWIVLLAVAICSIAQENNGSPVLHPFTVVRARHTH